MYVHAHALVLLVLTLALSAATVSAIYELPQKNDVDATDESNRTSTAAAATGSSSNDQWRVFLGLALLVVSYVLRVELVRFTLRLARRAAPGAFVWIKQFEKHLLQPLSWVVFLLLIWLSIYVMDVARLLHIDSDTITSLITLVLGFPLIWVVIAFCNYITWGIIRVKGWNRAASKDDDDYSRVMIITEGIGVIKILLVATVVSSFMIDEIGTITAFDSTLISTVAVLMIEVVFVFGAHSWLKNAMGGLMALLDEQIKSGSHIRFQGHDGVVERLYLQCFALRQYDKGLAYIPNGILLENTVEIQTKRLDRRVVVAIHLSHATRASTIRLFLQELDSYLAHAHADKRALRKTNAVLGFAGPLSASSTTSNATTRSSDFEDRRHKLTKGSTDDATDRFAGRFWIVVNDAFVVHVVYYTQERRIQPIMAEKTDVVLHITELLTKLELTLYGDENVAPLKEAPAPALSPRDAAIAALQQPLTRPHGRTVDFALTPIATTTTQAPTSLPPTFDRFRRYRSDVSSFGMRQRHSLQQHHETDD